MKKILIVTHLFFPKNTPRAFRATELLRELRKKGYAVDIIIGDYKQFLKNDEYDEKLLKYRDHGSTIVKNLSNNKLLSFIKDIMVYFIGDRFLLTSGLYVYKNIKPSNYDAIISIGLPFYINLVTALKIKKFKSMDRIDIAEWSDPFYGIKDNKVALYFKQLQKYICKKFDYIVIPTQNAINYFEEYTNIDKIKVIPQGFNFSEIELIKYKKNTTVMFAYAGIFYKGIRNPEKLLELLSKIDMEFVFTIYTVTHGPIYTDILMKYKKIMGNRLQINDLISRKECIKNLSRMDFLINIENSNSNQIPSKLIDYALTGRPILSFKHNEIPTKKITAFMNGDYSGAVKIDLEEYDIKNVCNKFIDLIEGRESIK